MHDDQLLNRAEKAGRSFEDMVVWLRSLGSAEIRFRINEQQRLLELHVRTYDGRTEKRLDKAVCFRDIDASRIPLVGLNVAEMALLITDQTPAAQDPPASV